MSDNNKIFTTIAIVENEKLSDAGETSVKTFTKRERTRLVNNYWKNIDADNNKRRRIFPIEYWELDALFNTSNAVGLIVNNIDDPEKVTVEWRPFDAQNPPALPDNSLCFVLSRNHYDGSIAVVEIDESSYELRGLADLRQPKPVTVFLCVLLGKDNDGKYFVFIQNARSTLLSKDMEGGIDTAPGGEGIGGIKIPSN
jgi:hypothetical protein